MPAANTPSLSEALPKGAKHPPFTLVVFPLPPGLFRVHAINGEERMNATYAFEITVTTGYKLAYDYERVLAGMRAVLVIREAPLPRGIHGVVRSIRCEGLRAGNRRVQYKITLVPGFDVLSNTRQSRIFQDVSASEVIDRILNPALPTRWLLSNKLPKRAYICQYEESDKAFVERLVAEAGLFYYFAQPAAFVQAMLAAGEDALADTGEAGQVVAALATLAEAMLDRETLVFGDAPSSYAAVEDASVVNTIVSTGGTVLTAVGTATGNTSLGSAATQGFQTLPSPTLHYLPVEGLAGDLFDKVTRLGSEHALATTNAEVNDYDPDRPLFPLAATAPDGKSLYMSLVTAGVNALTDPENALQTIMDVMVNSASALLPEHRFDYYEHHGQFHFPDWDDAEREPTRILYQQRRDAHRLDGSSHCPAFTPGHRFTLEGHPVGVLNREYALTRVVHRGTTVEGESTYANEFECVPSYAPYPAARPRRRTVQAVLTAKVVGPPGEVIHVDRTGRIKVRFHWDRQGARDGSSTCWLRVMQPWGGEGWGHQFIPRVGMEVVVAFEGGDPDKPIVMGSVYNATHVMPFPLPEEKARSGVKTRTVGAEEGYNELSMFDEAGREQIRVHAQKDLEETVESHHSLVTNTESIVVKDTRTEQVLKTLEQFVGARYETVGTDYRLGVEGDRHAKVAGHDALHVSKRATRRYEDCVEERVEGDATTIIGTEDRPSSYALHVHGSATLSATKSLVLECPNGVEIRCGATTIRLGPERLELGGKAIGVKGGGAGIECSDHGLKLSSEKVAQVTAKDALVKTKKASIGMGDEMRMDAPKVCINSPDQANEENAEPDPDTEFLLQDPDGNPLPRERYVIDLEDGTQRSGFTDDKGRVKLSLPTGGTISFPALDKVT
ncbi:MAG: type VI secretion system tip protein TssI/VgrG [Polyangiaceae bacterium]